MQRIDFSALKQRRSFRQLLKELRNYSKAWGPGGNMLTLCIVIGVILAIIGIVLLITNHKEISGLFWVGGFLIICGLIGMKDIAKELLKNDRLAKFAQANGFTFARDTFGDANYHGTYFLTHFVRIADMLRTPGQLFFEVGNFRIVGQQERSSSGPTYGYIRIKLPRRLPNMMLASKVTKQDLPLPGTINPNQRLSLEGNFNDIFTLYAPKDYERDALYVFTPDVMVKFMDLFGNFNSEIVDDEIYFYSSKKFDLTNPAVFTELLQTIADFVKKFDHQIDYYSDERGTSGERMSSAATNTVAASGRQLKSSPLLKFFRIVGILVILGIFGIGAYVLIRQSTQTGFAMMFRIFAAILITTIVVFISGALNRWWTRRSNK